MNIFLNEFLEIFNLDIESAKRIFFDPIFLIMTIISVIIIYIGFMKVNQKAGRNKYAALIPFWRESIWFKLADRSPIEFLFLIIYFVVIVYVEYLSNSKISSFLSLFELAFAVIVIYIYVSVISKIGENFGKSIFYRVLMLLFPTIFFPIIGYSKSKYLNSSKRGLYE